MARKRQKRKQPKRPINARPDSRLRFAALGIVLLVASGVILLGVVAFATGNGDDGESVAAPSPTPGERGFGPPPSLHGHVVEVIPDHGATVPQAATRTTNPSDPRGVCVRVEFGETDGQWYHMAVNGELVTQETIWILSDPTSPDTGRLCYDPPEGLPVGRVEAAVSVRDPMNLDAPPQEVVGWVFEVVE